MGSCIAVVSDLIFSSRIKVTAAQFGAECTTAGTSSGLQAALDAQNPALVLVDMNCEGLVPVEAIRAVKSRAAAPRVVAFFPHVQGELGERALAAGADDAWPRSAFAQRLPELLAGVADGPG